jgi:uncharacterized protein YndB with AHSA1/START domain
MPVYQTTFAVNAPAARVWAVLTAVDRYPEWNPHIPRVSGRLQPGSGSPCDSRSRGDRRWT